MDKETELKEVAQDLHREYSDKFGDDYGFVGVGKVSIFLYLRIVDDNPPTVYQGFKVNVRKLGGKGWGCLAPRSTD